MKEPSICLNGESRVLEDQTLQQLLQRLGQADRRGVAVAINDTVVPRSQWREAAIGDGDRIEIVVAVQGG